MKPFVVNRHGRIVFPFNFFPELDVSVFDTLEQFEAVIRRDFEDKARSVRDIVAQLDLRAYPSRYELLRDVAAHLFWAHRYPMTLYERRPVRWRDVPRRRPGVFLPVPRPSVPDPATAVIEAGYRALPPRWDDGTEHTIFGLLLDVFRDGKEPELVRQPLLPMVAEAMGDPQFLAYEIVAYDRDYPLSREDDVLGYGHRVPELEALMRQAMVLHNQCPWDREATRLTPLAALTEDAMVLVLHPRSVEVHRFLDRVKRGRVPAPSRRASAALRHPAVPV